MCIISKRTLQRTYQKDPLGLACCVCNEAWLIALKKESVQEKLFLHEIILDRYVLGKETKLSKFGVR